MDPLKLIPPKMWQHVFDKVENPRDWLNLYQSSPYFEEVVGEERTTSLFPQVIPHVMEYLLGEDLEILKLRQVSRPWKAAVDEALENVVIRSELKDVYNFESAARILSFLERFETHSGNPFVGRFASLKYCYPMSEDVKQYNILATRLLDKFGAQIKSLSVVLKDASFANIVTRVESNLQLVPNLVWLDITIFKYDAPDGVEDVLSRSSAIGLLPNLKSISFNIAAGVVDGVEILDIQNALVRLSCTPNSLKHVDIIGCPTELLRFPKVTSAVVRLLTKEDYNNLARTSWPLSNLTVGIFRNVPFLDPISLFQCVAHFQATLTSLRLMRPLFYDPLLKLHLPKLKRLTIQEHPQGMALKSFTKLANLEVLSIFQNPDLTQDSRWSNGRFVECVKDEVNRLKLWETLPKLRKIYLSRSHRNYCNRRGVR